MISAYAKQTAKRTHRVAVGPWSDLALHTIGWRAFQDLCSQLCEVVLRRPVEIFREAQDGGQDAVLLIPGDGASAPAIGTVQVKHSSDAAKALRASDIAAELESVARLVAEGQADTYIFMTNMSVDARVALEIRRRLRAIGVRKPHILGRQYVVRSIRSSARLRAMVPQVYGLGDLTAILDERMTQQSRALLEHWIPKLKRYVPTRAHREAVKAITEHGFVLLLGNPSSGKSAIGAILSTIASENPDSTVLILTSPRDFEKGWNPNDPGRFFWIDDAFGPNVVREDYVQDWASAFSKLRAAVAHGNRFLLTSRKHIYEAARLRLGQRNLAEFINGRAVVDVGALSITEKAQILYNHVNYGSQSQSWKSSVKPHLDAVAAVEAFLPGIAERLGDPNFTKSLAPREASLVQFMQDPREHLVDTINALDETLRAALVLVYVHRGAFNLETADAQAIAAVAELTGISRSRILDSFAELRGSFLKASGTGQAMLWSFAHPTIADALTKILREKSHMMEALLRGATVDTILTGFMSEGAGAIEDALSIPTNLNETLVARLAETPDETQINWSLFSFLSWRASDQVVERIAKLKPDILTRKAWVTDYIVDSPKLTAHARIHRLGLLADDLRERDAMALEEAALNELDLSFLDSEEMLGLIPPQRLVRLGMELRTRKLPDIEDRILELAGEADLDEDPESHFEKIVDAINRLEDMEIDPDGKVLIEDARTKIKASVKDLIERKEQRDSVDDDESDWTHLVTNSATPASSPTKTSNSGARSIFEDVDQN
ncbi:hypothetical protein [Mesorhizobium abyssinicae]|uniref:nSTAND3 domain-containing NTPase n=1 Tax=Mesorhizobium abyssinicae TaxID=1209958 RepID=UPI00339129E3